MKKRIKSKTLLISAALASAIIVPMTTYNNLSKYDFDSNVVNKPAKIKETKSKKDEKNEEQFKIDKTSIGSASTAIVAKVLGTEHVFMWGENSFGTLGVGESGTGQPNWGEIKTNPSNDDVTNVISNAVESLPAPEDVNVDGGESGIQGEVVSLSLGKNTSYIAIDPQDGSSITVYAAGANFNGEQAQGVGSTADSVKDNDDIWPYNSKFTPINFLNEDGSQIIIKDIYAMTAGDASTFISFKDDSNKNRVFSWGSNNSGELGAGINSEGAWAVGSSTNPEDNAIDEPIEITDYFDIPTNVAEANESDPLHWYFNEENGASDYLNKESFYDGPMGKASLEPGAKRTPEYAYPFTTSKINDEGYIIDKISSSAMSTIFEAKGPSGEKALFYAGDTVYKSSWVLMQNFSWDDKIHSGKTEKHELMSYRPALFFYDGMSGDKFFNESYFNDNDGKTDYINSTNIKLNDFITNKYITLLSLNIDGKDHLLATGSDKNYFTGVQGGLGSKNNGVMIQEEKDNLKAIYEPNLGWNYDDNIGLPEGGKILQLFSTEGTLGVLVSTPDELDKTKDVYSIITWGDNTYGLVHPELKGLGGSGNQWWYIGVPTLRLSTASDIKSYNSNYQSLPKNSVGNWTSGVEGEYNGVFDDKYWDDYISIKGWLKDFELNDLYDPSKNYAIEDVVTSLNNIAFKVTDGTDEWEYFLGSNEKKQITSVDTLIDANKGDTLPGDYIQKPTQLQFSAIPVSDSFKLDNNTTAIDGIEFSMDVISGSEMEPFLASEANSLILYGDLNKDTKTSDDEEFGTDKAIDAPNLGSGAQVHSGKVEYIGRGDNTGTLKDTHYDTTDIPESEQRNKVYQETYHFKISELEQGSNFDYLYASVNGHHKVSVDGTLQTLQSAKINPETVKIIDTNSDYIDVELEILDNVPGYEGLSVDGVVKKEPSAKEYQDALKIFTGSSYDDKTPLGTIENLEIISRHPDDQKPAIGAEPIGTKVSFRLSGLSPNTSYKNIYTLIDKQGNPLWNYRIIPNAEFATFNILNVSGYSLIPSSVDYKSFKFTLDIKQGEVIENNNKVNYQDLDKDNVIINIDESHNGETPTNTDVTAKYIEDSENEIQGKYQFEIDELTPNTKYTIKNITINEDYKEADSHTIGTSSFSPTADNTVTTKALPNEFINIVNESFVEGTDDGTEVPTLSFDMSVNSGGNYQTIDWDPATKEGVQFTADVNRLGSGAGKIDLSKTSWTAVDTSNPDANIDTYKVTFNLENNAKYSNIKYSLDGGESFVKLSGTKNESYSTASLAPLYTKGSLIEKEEGPNPDSARFTFKYNTGGQYGDLDKDKISFSLNLSSKPVSAAHTKYVSGENAKDVTEEETEWVFKIDGLEPNTEYTDVELKYDGKTVESAKIDEIKTTAYPVELGKLKNLVRESADNPDEPMYNINFDVDITSGGEKYDLDKANYKAKFVNKEDEKDIIDGTITLVSSTSSKSSEITETYHIEADGLNGNKEYKFEILQPVNGVDATINNIDDKAFAIGKFQFAENNPISDVSVDVVDETTVNVNYVVSGKNNLSDPDTISDNATITSLVLDTDPESRTDSQIVLDSTEGKHSIEVSNLTTNQTYSDWTIKVSWTGDVFNKTYVDTISIEEFTVEKAPTAPIALIIFLLLLFLLLLILLILLILWWLIYKNVNVVETIEAEKGKVRFTINRDRYSEFDKLIEGRKLTAINNDASKAERKEFKYSVEPGELNELIFEITGINNKYPISKIIIHEDEAANQAASMKAEQDLNAYETALEQWTAERDAAKEAEQEFNKEKPAKPAKAKLTRPIKVRGKVDTEIIKEPDGKEPEDYEEAKKASKYAARRLAFQKTRNKTAATVSKKSNIKKERERAVRIITDSKKEISSAKQMLSQTKALEKKLKRNVEAHVRVIK